MTFDEGSRLRVRGVVRPVMNRLVQTRMPVAGGLVRKPVLTRLAVSVGRPPAGVHSLQLVQNVLRNR